MTSINSNIDKIKGLRPCPGCGGKDLAIISVIQTHPHGKCVKVECEMCGAQLFRADMNVISPIMLEWTPYIRYIKYDPSLKKYCLYEQWPASNGCEYIIRAKEIE